MSRRIPGHIREFNWLEPHLDHEMVFKTWQNWRILAALGGFSPLVETHQNLFLEGQHRNINKQIHRI